jgi:predicted lipase
MPLTKVTVVQSEGHQALVGFDTKRNSVMVALRGSLSIQDWIDNLKAVHLVPFPVCSGCEIASGFQEAAVSLRYGVENAVADILAAVDPAKTPTVVFTGHSLGAAMAAILLANSSAFSFAPLIEMPVYTFGQPRVGNPAFEAWFDGMFRGKWFRVVHHDDPVPHLPTVKMGFAHVATEIWYMENGTGEGVYEVCSGSGEDQQCSAGTLLSGEITDHLTYMGHPVCGCVPSGF